MHGKSQAEIKAIKREYKKKTGKDLDEDLRDELNETELKEAKAEMSGDPVNIAVAKLEAGASGGLLGGTDEDKIKATLDANLPIRR